MAADVVCLQQMAPNVCKRKKDIFMIVVGENL